MSLLYILSSLFFGAFFLYSFLKRRKQNVNKKYPPGPSWSLPLVGHLLYLGLEPWKTQFRWKKKYGSVISVDFASFRTIVLNDAKSIRDAFNLNAAAGRPKIPMLEAFGHEKAFSVVDGTVWSEQRMFVIRQLKNLNAIKAAEEKIMEEVEHLLQKFSSESKKGEPISINHSFQIAALNSVWSLLMGYRFDLDDPELLKLGRNMCKAGEFNGIMDSLVLFIPIMGRIFPAALGKFTKLRQDICDTLNKEFEKNDPSYIPGQPRNFKEAFRDEIDAKKGDPNSTFQKSMFSYTAGDILITAMDTTSNQMDWIILYLSTHPEKQEKLYQEIKATIGISRLPCASDRVNCHYAEAVVNESLRHSSIVPLGIWHRAIDDIQDFHGYSIDKDTMIVSNTWAVHRDPELWLEPEEWRPERFLGPDGKFQKSDNLLAFSSGRRTCIGEEVARLILFLITTSLVQRFQISYPRGKKASFKAVAGIMLQPQPFQVIFKERENF